MDRIYLSDAPLEYQNVAWVKEFATLAQGSLWTVHYAQMVYYSFRDQSYGMALLPLCNNFAWELTYCLVYPPDHLLQQAVLISWLGLNLLVMYSAVKFAPNEWSHAPLVRDSLAFIIPLGVLIFFSGHIALAKTMGPDRALMWGAMLSETFLTVGGVCQLMVRGSSRALSFPLFLTRFFGAWVNTVPQYMQYLYWPEQFARLDKPIGLWIPACSFAADLVYGILLWSIRQKERRAAPKTNGRVKSG